MAEQKKGPRKRKKEKKQKKKKQQKTEKKKKKEINPGWPLDDQFNHNFGYDVAWFERRSREEFSRDKRALRGQKSIKGNAKGVTPQNWQA